MGHSATELKSTVIGWLGDLADQDFPAQSARRCLLPLTGRLPGPTDWLNALSGADWMTHRTAEHLALRLRPSQSGVDPLLDHRSFEFREGAADLEYQLSHRRRGVDRLLVDVEVNPDRLEVLDRSQRVDQASSEPVDCPAKYDIEVPVPAIIQHPVRAWPIGSRLAAGNTSIGVNLDHFPASTFGNLPQLDFLVFDGLAICADAQVKRGAARGSESCSGFSATLTTVAFDESGLR